MLAEIVCRLSSVEMIWIAMQIIGWPRLINDAMNVANASQLLFGLCGS